MRRRDFLIAFSGLAASTFTGQAMAAEGTGKWSDESRAEYNNKLFDWLRKDFEGRAAILSKHLKSAFEIKYDYLDVSSDAKRARLFEKYAKGRMSGKDADEHVAAALADFERVRQEIAAAEGKAMPEWKYEGGNVFVKEGKIYELEIAASRLTVVLDASPSMAPYLDRLREEISRDFPQTHFVEVDGCQLERPAEVPWFFAGHSPFVNPFMPSRHIPKVPVAEEWPYGQFVGWTRDCPAALECMVDLMETDAIYWFCDFDDPTRDEVIRPLARKIMDAKAKLYVHTLDKRPPALISQLAELSGGKVIKKRF